MSNKILIIGALVVALGLIAFGRVWTARTSPPPASASGSAGLGYAGTRQVLAPALTLPKLGGGSISLSDFRGQKPVVLDFWASWCPNCRRDMPRLNGWYEKYKDRVEVIGINLQEDPLTVQNFIQSRNISFPIALDPTGQAAGAFGIQYTNTHFLINKDGFIIGSIPGDIQESDIVSLLQ